MICFPSQMAIEQTDLTIKKGVFNTIKNET